MKYLLTMICLLAMVTSCSSDHEDDGDGPQVLPVSSRTVLVYMSAENNLSINADDNLGQMAKGAASLGANYHLIAFVDQNNSDMPYMAEISQGKISKVKEFASDINAADPREMRDIIKWTADNYPADDYGLILWGHASGWLIKDSVATRSGGPKRAFGIDNGYGKWMNTPSMARYIAESGVKFHYIFADACCFQCVENAYELRNVTDLLIGAPSEIPGDGAPYDAIISHLFNGKDDFYKGVIEEYEKRYELQGCSVPLSVIKTSEMDNLALAAHDVWAAMPQPWPSADNVIYYFKDNKDNSKKICYDALDIVRANTIETITGKWQTALNKAVIYSNYNTKYEWMTDGFVNFNDFTLDLNRMACVSMFVPLETYGTGKNSHNELISRMAWHKASGMADVWK